MRQQHRVWRGSGRAALVIAGLLLGTVGLWQAAPGAQGVQGTSTLTGRVTADKGEVRALRVQARDAGRGIVYTVFTTEGQYRILNLPAGTYEVQVVEGTFRLAVQRMTLAVGQTGTVNLAIAQKADAGSQYTQIVNSRSASLGAVNATAELVEFDELYPPGPGRDLLIAECTGCHGPGWHRLEGQTAEQWAKGLERMFINDSGGQHYARKIVGPGAMSAVEKQALITYLATAFGPNYKPTKDLRLDPIVRDEEALSRAIFIQYELPPMADPEEAKARGLRRGTHDVFPASEPGKIWMAGFFSSSVVQVDVNNPDIEARTKEWDIPSDTPRGARPPWHRGVARLRLLDGPERRLHRRDEHQDGRDAALPRYAVRRPAYAPRGFEGQHLLDGGGWYRAARTAGCTDAEGDVVRREEERELVWDRG